MGATIRLQHNILVAAQPGIRSYGNDTVLVDGRISGRIGSDRNQGLVPQIGPSLDDKIVTVAGIEGDVIGGLHRRAVVNSDGIDGGGTCHRNTLGKTGQTIGLGVGLGLEIFSGGACDVYCAGTPQRGVADFDLCQIDIVVNV